MGEFLNRMYSIVCNFLLIGLILCYGVEDVYSSTSPGYGVTRFQICNLLFASFIFKNGSEQLPVVYNSVSLPA